MSEHGEAIEADLHRFHGFDLWPDLGCGRLSWRRLRVFVENLPPDSATVRAELGDRSRWAVGEQLLNEVVHLLELQLWQHADPKSRGPVPELRRTPWDDHRVSELRERLIEFRDRARSRARQGET